MVLGILLVEYLPSPAVLWPGLASGAALLSGWVVFSRGRSTLGKLSAVLGLWSLAGAAGYALGSRLVPPDDIVHLTGPRARLVRLRGRLTARPFLRVTLPPEGTEPASPFYRSTADLRVEALFAPERGEWVPAAGKVRLTVRDRLSGLLPGDRIEVTGWLRRLPPAGNPGQFDFARRERRRGTRALLTTTSADNLTVSRRAPWPWRGAFHRARSRLTESILDRFGASGPLLLSLLLGERGYLDIRTRQDLVHTGTMHFLSISGLHVGIVASAVWWMLRLLAVSRRRSALAVLAAVVVYVLLTGLRPGAVRAAVMCAVFCGGVFFARPVSPLNSLALAAWLILCVSPAQLFEAGFQLSFAAVAGIFAFFAPVRLGLLALLRPQPALLRLTRAGRLRGTVTGALVTLTAVGTSAWLAVAPILAYYFHLVTPYAVPLSLVVFPVVSALVLLGLVYLLLSVSVPGLAWLLVPLVAGLAGLQRGLLRLAAGLPGVVVYVAAPSLLFLVCYYGFWGVVRWGWVGPWLRARRRGDEWEPEGRSRRRVSGYRLLAAGLLLVSLFVVRPVLARRPRGLTLTMLDVGHGLSVVVRMPNGTTLLYDAGGGSPTFDVGERVIAPALWAADVPRLDALVLSHHHWDHTGGVPALLERLPVRSCFISRFLAESPPGARILDALRERGVPVHEVARGDRIVLDPEVSIRVLNPPRGPVGRLLSTNEASVALLIEYRGRRVLLLADVTGDWLNQVLREVDGPVDVVQVPHHGLPDVNLEQLVHRARPRYALISAAAGERQEAARKHLVQAGVATLATYRHGALTIRFSGPAMEVSTYRQEPFLEPPTSQEPALAPEER